MTDFRLMIEVEAATDNPELLEEIIWAVVSEGLAQYKEYGELEQFARLRVRQSPAYAAEETVDPRYTRFGERWRRLEHRRRETSEPSAQLALFGPA